MISRLRSGDNAMLDWEAFKETMQFFALIALPVLAGKLLEWLVG